MADKDADGGVRQLGHALKMCIRYVKNHIFALT